MLRFLAAATVVLGQTGSESVAQGLTSLPGPPNSVRLLLTESDQSLAVNDFGAAVDALQQLLDLEEDYFDPRAERRSIKRHAERTLRLLPPEGLRVYQRRYGPAAETLLAEARRTGDDGKLSEVVRRYAMTDAGAVAIELLADRLWDAGALLTAGRLFDRLLNHPNVDDAVRAQALVRAAVCWWGCGNEARARDRLAAWSRLAAESNEVSRGSLPIAPGDADADTDWLTQAPPHAPVWPGDNGERVSLFRGDPQRSGVFDRATPTGGIVWSYPAMDEIDSWEADRIPEVDAEIDALESRVRAEAGRERAVLPAGIPVISENRVVFRGYASLKWVDPVSGEFIWSGADRDQTFKHLVEEEWRPAEDDWHSDNLQLFLGQRAWRDVTCGALSCDERYVYSIFNPGIVSAMGSTVQSIANLVPHPLAPRPYNSLEAYEIDLCRLVWEQGGPPQTGSDKLTGVFFLGPPLTLDGLLYCLIDDRKQVRLVVVDPQRDPDTDDEIVWEQPLYNAEHHLSNAAATTRRLSGLTPSASGDVLVCPTGESMLVAVDGRTRQLLWAFQYREISLDPRAQQLAAVMMAQRQLYIEEQILSDLLEDDRWHDSAPIISGEHVLYTPPDQDEILCLRLTDGHLEWRKDRQEGIFVAGIYDGNVIIVGSSQVRALRLSDGETAWPEPIPIPAPSGRGFQHDRFYVLPLSSGEIASIDLRDARILVRSPMPEGWVPGNLCSARGRVYSQTARGLAAFASLEEQQREIEERLAANPEDAEALALRGEQRLHLGEIAAGISDLRRSLTMTDDSRVRELLASTLIEGLRVDFAGYRDAADEIDELVREPLQRATFLRLLADGLQRSGDVVAAFEAFIRFAGEEISETLRDGADGHRLVHSDHWVRARMEDLYFQADGPAREILDDLIARTVTQAVHDRDINRVRDLLVMLPSATHIEPLRLALADQLEPDQHAAEVELQLLELMNSTNVDVQSAASARLMKLYLEDGVSNPIAFLSARLTGPYADRPCLAGKTGGELMEEWTRDPAYRDLLSFPEVWPVDQVEVDASRPRTLPQLHPVEHLGPPSETLRGWRFYLDLSGNSLQAFDEHGADRWRVPVGQPSTRRGQPGPGYARYVRTLGRLVLLVTNDSFFILDALADERDARVLVNDQLYRLEDRTSTFMTRIQFGPGANPRRGMRNQVRASNGQTSGNVGPILIDGLVYQQGSTIRAIDPLSGDMFWERESPEIPAGAEILADSESVVVWPPNQQDVLVLRAADGAAVLNTRLPRNVLNPQPDGDWGCCLVLEDEERQGESADRRLALFDPVSQNVRWELSFQDLLDWTVLDGSDFALLRDGGLVTVIDGMTGEERFSEKLDDEQGQWIAVDRFHDQLLVMTGATPPDEKQVQPWSNLRFPVVHGQIALLTLDEGRTIWSRRLEHQTYVRNLPGRWPLLAFAASIYEAGRQPVENYTAVLLLNRLTGEVLYEATRDRSINKYGWLSRPDQHRLELSFSHESIALRFNAAADGDDPDQPPN